jgi:AraC family transcriptional regulator of adaptative response/methylated-DNA-[protein]-cysteine methyltransferase
MTDYERIEKVIQYLMEHQAEQPGLETLAGVAGVSKFHFQRIFSRWAGVTPKMFLKFLTAHYAKNLLHRSTNVLDVSFQVGLSGPGRLHDLLVTVDGVTPGEFKAQGAGIEIRYGFHPTPFGKSLIGVTKRGVCHFAFLKNDKEQTSALKQLQRNWPKAVFKQDQPKTAELINRIFQPSAHKQSVCVFLMGTPFQLKVWEALLQIAPGRVGSYSDIARLVGMPKASRAVGNAMAKNPVGYLIPCHRVIRQTGLIGQYGWGPVKKQALLLWEHLQKTQATETKR